MDYIIKDGWIVNGKKEKPFHGDLVIENGKIAEVGAHVEIPADFPKERVLNAAGGYITPGFIDIHRHGDWQAFGNGDDELLNRQGLTTVVNGNCGLSVAPAGEKFGKEIAGFLSSVTGDFRLGKDRTIEDTESVLSSKKKEASCKISAKESERDALEIMSTMSAYMSALAKEKRSVNTGMLAGNGTIRAGVKGYAPGKLSKEEVHQVWKAVEESLAAGALGISLGIAYAPEFEYDRDGLVEALQPLKGTDIPITTHIRNEGDGILLALQEVISVAEELQIPLHVSHMKCIGRKNWGETPVKILKLFDQAAERGVKVDFDLYPYLTGSTQLVHLLPPQFQEGGTDAICARLADPSCRKEITKVLRQPSDIFENIVELAGFDRIYASTLHTEKFRSFAGESIAKIAEQFGQDPYDTLYDILLAERCQVTMLDTIASEEDMLYFLKDSRANLISDAIYPAGGKYHPRVYGAFPKLLTDYVRDKKVFSIEDAVYKMTAKPAQVLGLPLGTLEKGMPADINVFHLDRLKVHADFQNPDQYCTGFDYVLVGGEIAVEQDKWKNSRSGRIVRRNA
ncbi:N-acyl-D-amino-acid deacylase family protein [Blautia sp. Sow4_E7]|uniref:N-acyl-D-amino-acid deacylase family protein n=1 Tax=Blautia sp. Sow4_E7 TaxID=3438749 RepID=UPI003F91C8EA